MSGGTLLGCYYAEQFADDLDAHLDETLGSGEARHVVLAAEYPEGPTAIAELRRIGCAARRLAKFMRQADLFVSGDTSAETFLRQVCDLRSSLALTHRADGTKTLQE